MVCIKKFKFNRNYLETSAYALAILIIVIIFEKFLGSMGDVMSSVKAFFSTAVKVLSPFIYGFVIAYFTNVPVRWIEQRLCKISYFSKRKKITRGICILITYILLLGGISFLIVYLVPQVVSSAEKFWLSLDTNIANIERTYYNIVGDDNWLEVLADSINGFLKTEYTSADIIGLALEPLTNLFTSVPATVSSIFFGIFNFAYGALQFALGLIIAVYMLFAKDDFAVMGNKLIFSVFKKYRAQKIMRIVRSSNKIFESFIVGKTIDSLIIGVMFYYICLMCGFPYAVLLSAIVGVTNMIPYFGPFIGAVPVIIIVFLNNPMSMQAIWVAIAIFILQQFDGIILGPKILGDSTGLSPIGVIFAILVGGAIWGVPGMFFGVPLFAVIKNSIYHMLDVRFDKAVHEDSESLTANIPEQKNDDETED